MEQLNKYKQGAKISSQELCKKFNAYNEGVEYATDKRKPLEALVMLKADRYRVPVAEQDRCYHITSKNKMFYSGLLGYSCFGHSASYDDRLEEELTTGKGVEGIVLL